MLIARPDVDAMPESITMFLATSRSIDYPAVHEVRTAIEIQVAGLSAEHASDEEVSGLRVIYVDFEGSVAESAQFQFGGVSHSRAVWVWRNSLQQA